MIMSRFAAAMKISALYSWARIDGDRNVSPRSGNGGVRTTLNVEHMEYSSGSSAAFKSDTNVASFIGGGRGVVLPAVLRLLAIAFCCCFWVGLGFVVFPALG
jgi:hypothetical protein